MEFLGQWSTAVFSVMCHQDPATLMRIAGKEVLLCPRCMGLQMGFLAGLLQLSPWSGRRITVTTRGDALALGVAVGLLALDWGLGQLGARVPTVSSRLISGLAAGSALAVLVLVYLGAALPSILCASGQVRAPRTARVVLLSVASGLLLASIPNHGVVTLALLLAVLANAVGISALLVTLARFRLAAMRSARALDQVGMRR